MIYRDASGFLVDETLDGGDSALREAIAFLFSEERDLRSFYERDGLLVRHPEQVPWNNPLNMSRDNSVPIIAALPVEAVRRVFWRTVKRGFFAQNIERDYPGSRKYPWPHKIKVGDPVDIGTWRVFDYADPLMPDHIWHLIWCGRLWPLYWWAVIGVPWMVVSMWLHAHSSHKEHNQIICMCVRQGQWAVRLFKWLTPTWKQDLLEYWGSRNEVEYAVMVIGQLEAA